MSSAPTAGTSRAWSASTACRDSGRTPSSTASYPTTTPSRTTWSTAALRAAQGRRRLPEVRGGPAGPDRAGARAHLPPLWSRRRRPRPLARDRTEAHARPPPAPAVPAAATTVRPSGCSLSASTAAARASSASRSVPGVGGDVRDGRPRVSVPVLSKSTASTVRSRSRASRFLTSTPTRAVCSGSCRLHHRRTRQSFASAATTCSSSERRAATVVPALRRDAGSQ